MESQTPSFDSPVETDTRRSDLRSWERVVISIGASFTALSIGTMAGAIAAGLLAPACGPSDSVNPFAVLAEATACLDNELRWIFKGAALGLLVGAVAAVSVVLFIRHREPKRLVVWPATMALPMAALVIGTIGFFTGEDASVGRDACQQAFDGPHGSLQSGGSDLLGDGAIVIVRGNGLCVVTASGPRLADTLPLEGTRFSHVPDVALSPSDDRIAMVQRDGVLSISGLDGSNRIEVIQDPSTRWPSWSGDGSKLAFELPNGVWLVDSDGRELHQIAQSFTDRYEHGFHGWQPTLSPNADRVAVVACPRNAVGGCSADDELWIIDIASGEATRVSDPYSRIERPMWSPSADIVVFETEIRHLRLVDLTTGEGRSLVTSAHAPFWSPDGDLIGFVRTTAGLEVDEEGIWAITPLGADLRQVYMDDMVGAGSLFWLSRVPAYVIE